jgi:hypothetical protein
VLLACSASAQTRKHREGGCHPPRGESGTLPQREESAPLGLPFRWSSTTPTRGSEGAPKLLQERNASTSRGRLELRRPTWVRHWSRSSKPVTDAGESPRAGVALRLRRTMFPPCSESARMRRHREGGCHPPRGESGTLPQREESAPLGLPLRWSSTTPTRGSEGAPKLLQERNASTSRGRLELRRPTWVRHWSRGSKPGPKTRGSPRARKGSQANRLS